MATTLTHKILSDHLVTGEMTPGSEIGIRIDQTLTQDATGTTAFLLLEAMEIPRVRTEASVSYVDHNMAQFGPENHNDHLYLQSISRKVGAHHSRPGNGICHQVHLERFARPGRTLLGSDSHTPAGGMGSLAMGAGGLDVAVAMGGGAFYLTCPKVIGVEIRGHLRPWVAAKDIILHLLSILTTKGNVGCVVNGAGLAMATMDLIKRYGGEPANFLDVGGSSSPDKMVTAMRIILSDPNVKTILINIFGGITRCDDIANGLLAAQKQAGIRVPLVARLTGTNAEKAREMLKGSPVAPAETMADAVKKAVTLARSNVGGAE